MEEPFVARVTLKEKETLQGYLKELPAVKYLTELSFDHPVTFFVGENGTGKSTLLEAIAAACGFNPEGGSKNFRFSTNSTHSELYRHLKVIRGTRRERDGFFLRAESFYNVATNIEELDAIEAASPKISSSYGGRSLHHQSHGESFLALIRNRFGGNGLYILDEPEAALSPASLLILLRSIYDLVNQNSQFIVATHSPILMAYPNAVLYELNDCGMKKTSYYETNHYRLTKQFMDCPERMLKVLLED